MLPLGEATPQRVLEALEKASGAGPGLRLAAAPELIQPGPENLVLGLELSQGPPELRGPLILRRYPPDRDARGVRFEAALHGALRAQGFPVPGVRLCCEDPALLGGAFLVMERLAGRSLLADLSRLDEALASPGRAARTLARLSWEAALRLPAVLADLQLRLHALDAARLAAAVEAEGFDVGEFAVAGRLARLERRAAEHGLDGLGPALGWLRARYQPPRHTALCHADLQFLNVLLVGRRVTGVIDWSVDHCSFGDPEFDVGNTTALLSLPVPGLPAIARPPLAGVQRLLLARFRRRMARGSALDAERVRWAEVFRYVREMVLAGALVRAGAPAATGFLRDGEVPWLVSELRRATLAAISERTGLPASIPEPGEAR